VTYNLSATFGWNQDSNKPRREIVSQAEALSQVKLASSDYPNDRFRSSRAARPGKGTDSVFVHVLTQSLQTFFHRKTSRKYQFLVRIERGELVPQAKKAHFWEE
jgi:hypothetical protein